MTSTRPLRLTVVALGLAIAAPAAHADVAPPAHLTRVPVTHVVKGLDAIPKTYTVALATVRASERDYAAVRWNLADGDLKIPSGYMLSSTVVALDAGSLAVLAKAYVASKPEGLVAADVEGKSDAELAAWIQTQRIDGGELQPVADFLRKGAFPRSDGLPFRTTVPKADKISAVTQGWKVTGIDGDAVTLVADEAAAAPAKSGAASTSNATPSAAPKSSGCDAGGPPASLWLTALVALALLWRRRRVEPHQV